MYIPVISSAIQSSGHCYFAQSEASIPYSKAVLHKAYGNNVNISLSERGWLSCSQEHFSLKQVSADAEQWHPQQTATSENHHTDAAVLYIAMPHCLTLICKMQHLCELDRHILSHAWT